MFYKKMAVLAVAIGLSNSAVQAETCGGSYTIQSGDSLSKIASDLYQNKDKWSVIYNSNIDTIGANPGMIRVGTSLHMTCIDGLPTGLSGGTDVSAKPEAAPIVTIAGTAATRKKITFLYADDYKPFMDRSLPNGGLLTEVVQQAMEAADPEEGFSLIWVNDNDAHLEPLISNALLDFGVGWFKPDCEANPDAYRCKNFDFTDSTFEVLILLFTNKANPITFNNDSDIVGKTLCRPSGYFTHDLDKNGRNWMLEGKITLKTPDTVKGCFDLLAEGKVDAVAINEFTGREALKDLGLKDHVIAIDTRPLSIEGQHLLIHKSHPRGQELLAEFNKGLKMIKETGEYQRIIDEHMTRIWSDF